MNAKELRAAATNLARHMEIVYASTAAMGPTPIQRMAGTLIDHILATVREDDNELVALDWLEQLARVDGKLDMMSVVWRVDGFHFSANGHESPEPATRGEFRAMCRLLGVTLKEDANYGTSPR